MNGYGFLMHRLKDTLILIAWIAGLLLIGALSWGLTRSIRTDFLQESINRVFIRMGDSRRLEAPIAPGTLKIGRGYGPLSPQGAWFSLRGERNRILFFTLIGDGAFLPCGAIVNYQGKVIDIIPLSSRGERQLGQVSPGIIALYIKRIERGL